MRDHQATGVVTNLSNTPMLVAGDIPGVIPPWKSTILCGGTIIEADLVSIIDVPDDTNLGGLPFDGWDWFGDRMPEFPRSTPLYISAKDIVGQVTLNPWTFSNHPEPKDETDSYDIQLNLWWAPAKTDAVIHNTHAFLEIHTQISASAASKSTRTRPGPSSTARSAPPRATPTIPSCAYGAPVVRLSLAPRLDRHRRDLDGDRAHPRGEQRARPPRRLP